MNWKFYIKTIMRMVLMVALVIFVLHLIVCLIGCDSTYPYTGYDSDYVGSSCSSICNDHCDTCWSYSSDILKCERDCTSLCRQRGCDYISVPSSSCDDAFQSVCM